MDVQFLLDTNIWIYIRRQRPAHVLARFQGLESGQAALSVVTYGELFYGAVRGSNPTKAFRELDELKGLIQVLPMPMSAARCYGEIRATLEAKGEVIGANDLWIAAHAMTAEVTLVTNNEREFKRVRGLRIENWVK